CQDFPPASVTSVRFPCPSLYARVTTRGGEAESEIFFSKLEGQYANDSVRLSASVTVASFPDPSYDSVVAYCGKAAAPFKSWSFDNRPEPSNVRNSRLRRANVYVPSPL